MERGKTDVSLEIASPLKNTSLIEWNVDMRVTVSSVKKSKMFQRSRNIVIVILAIVFAVAVSHFRREMRALQVQMQSVNLNLLVLMSKYDRLNRSLNRAWIQRTDVLYEKRIVRNARTFLEEIPPSSRTSEILHILNTNNGRSSAGNSVIPPLNPVLSPKDKFSDSAVVRGRNTGDNYPTESTGNDVVEGNESENNLRIERAVSTFEIENLTTRKNASSMREKITRNDDYDASENDDVDVWKEPRSGRSRRDEGRGKKRGKNKRRPKRGRRRLGPLVATFVGAVPEQHVTDTVYVGPWVKSTKNDSQYSLNKFHLVEDKKSIEVTTSGLYMISAQIFYFGEPTNYSYWILLSSEGKSATQRLVKCSTASSTSATEVSCYTSVITLLQRGDRLHIQQQERDRLINMREGHSYIQLVLLSDNVRRRRLT